MILTSCISNGLQILSLRVPDESEFSAKRFYRAIRTYFETTTCPILIDCDNIHLSDPLQTQVVLSVLSCIRHIPEEYPIAILRRNPDTSSFNKRVLRRYDDILTLSLTDALAGFLTSFASLEDAQQILVTSKSDLQQRREQQ